MADDQGTIRLEAYPRRLRAFVDGRAVIDSTRVFLLLEPDRLPVYYFPPADAPGCELVPSQRPEAQTRRGPAQVWAVRVGDRLVPDAAVTHSDPPPALAALRDLVAIRWDAVESWFEEDDEVFVHPREPYHRVDVLPSSRHVRVEAGGRLLAESDRPWLLFETGLPVRYYLPRTDVRMEALRPSATSSQCPYKGVATYWSTALSPAEDAPVEDVAWSYPFPIPECPKIAGLVAFFNERVDLWVDGVAQPRPATLWS